MTPSKTIALAGDHAGVRLKSIVKDYLAELGFEALDLGPDSAESVDYPDFGYKLAAAIANGEADRGIAICGSGIGISMALNRHPDIRCALVTNGLMARLSRAHNDANVLALGDRLTGDDTAKDCVREFIETRFEGGRHQRRVNKLANPTLQV
ncbi:MAG: ribose 5-phosphate isomerase B [Pseudomonadota bacterium]